MTNTNDTGGVRVSDEALRDSIREARITTAMQGLHPELVTTLPKADWPRVLEKLQATYRRVTDQPNATLSAIEPPKPEVARLDERGIAAAYAAVEGLPLVDLSCVSGELDTLRRREGARAAVLSYLSALPASQDGEKAVAWTKPKCPYCKGTGIEADYVGPEMRCVASTCSHCNGEGFDPDATPPTPEAGKYADGVRPTFEQVRDRALAAVKELDDWTNVNETEFTGWGDGEVPAGATWWRIKSGQALAALGEIVKRKPEARP
jgi:hypothetical protein